MKQDIENHSKQYNTATIARDVDNTLWGGREALVAAGGLYLPQLPGEGAENWKLRISGARFFPFYPEAVIQLADRLREGLIRPDEKAHEFLIDWYSRQKINSIMNAVRIDGLRRGCSFVLVDYDTDGITLNHIKHDDMLEFWPDEGDLKYCRFMREVTGIGGASYNLVYIVEMTADDLLTTEYSNESGEYVETDSRDYPQARQFPIIKLRYGDSDFNPFFRDLAWLNIAHWESISHQVRALNTSRFDMLYLRGWNADTQPIASPYTVYMLSEGGEAGRIQGGGPGIEAGERDLLNLEKTMQTMAAAPMQSNANISATATARDATQQDAPISRLVEMEMEAMTEILKAVAAWAVYAGIARIDLDNPALFAVDGQTDFTPNLAGANDAAAILNALAVGAIDQATARRGLVNAIPSLNGINPDDIAAAIDGGG